MAVDADEHDVEARLRRFANHVPCDGDGAGAADEDRACVREDSQRSPLHRWRVGASGDSFPAR